MPAQAEYRVRTPLAYLVRVGVLFAIGVIVAAWLVQFVERGVPEDRYDLVLVGAVAIVLPFAFWFRSAHYRIGGGRNLIRFHADRLEIPDARRRQPLVFARDRAQFAIGPVRGGYVLRVADGTTSRALTTAVVEDRHDIPALIADFRRYAAGRDALGKAAHDRVVRTEYDDRLDRELAKLD